MNRLYQSQHKYLSIGAVVGRVSCTEIDGLLNQHAATNKSKDRGMDWFAALTGNQPKSSLHGDLSQDDLKPGFGINVR